MNPHLAVPARLARLFHARHLARTQYNDTMPDAATKLPSRQTLRALRRAIAPAERLQAAEQLAQRVLDLPELPTHGHVAGYWACDGELSLDVLQQRLPASLTYCLPVLDEVDRVLRFAPWRAGDALRHNRYGIPEPPLALSRCLPITALSCILLPLTGFDAQCHRLGMGGGWYDRSLAARCVNPPLRIGIGFDVQEVLAGLSPAPWDVPCDVIITPTRTLRRETP